MIVESLTCKQPRPEGPCSITGSTNTYTAAGEDVWAVASPRGGISLPAILTRLPRTEQGVFGFGGKNVQTQTFG